MPLPENDEKSSIDPRKIMTREGRGDALRRLRGDQSIRSILAVVKRVAKEHDMSPPTRATIYNWSSQNHVQPRQDNLEVYLRACGVPPEELEQWFEANTRAQKSSAVTTPEATVHGNGPNVDETDLQNKSTDQTGVGDRDRSDASTISAPPAESTRRGRVLTGIVVAGVLVLALAAVMLSIALTPATNAPAGQSTPVQPTTPAAGDPPTPPQATFAPITTPIAPGTNVPLTGQVSGLIGGELWIIEQPADDTKKFVISSGGPALVLPDGHWTLTADEVGDPSDRKSSVAFIAVSADATCSSQLSTVTAVARDGEASIPAIPPGCTRIGATTVSFTP